MCRRASGLKAKKEEFPATQPEFEPGWYIPKPCTLLESRIIKYKTERM
jgi:hypothetical protein